MIKFAATDLEDALRAFKVSRSTTPFALSGRHYLGYHDGIGWCYRSKKKLLGKLGKLGATMPATILVIK